MSKMPHAGRRRRARPRDARRALRHAAFSGLGAGLASQAFLALAILWLIPGLSLA